MAENRNLLWSLQFVIEGISAVGLGGDKNKLINVAIPRGQEAGHTCAFMAAKAHSVVSGITSLLSNFLHWHPVSLILFIQKIALEAE